MYKQVLDPVGDSLFLSSLFALIPILTLFVLLGGLRIAAHIASPVALLLALLVAIIIYGMPVGQALDAGLQGAAFGLFPIMWIVWNAIWIYNMTEETGHFAVLRRSFSSLSNDQRIQAVIIAFCFGALLEALAGFGTPVAITAVMLVAVGFQPMKAAAVALVANTAPVAFGAIADPDRHALGPHGHPEGGPRRDGRPPDAVPGADRAADPRRHGRRLARRARGLARRARRRLRLRPRPVPVLELRLGRADRHRRLAALRRRDRRAAARVAAVGPADRRDGGGRAARDGRRRGARRRARGGGAPARRQHARHQARRRCSPTRRTSS